MGELRSMSSSGGIFIVTQEPQTAKSVTDAIGSSEQMSSGGVFKNLDDLLVALDRSPAQAVLVDIDPKPVQILSELDAIITRYAGTRFIVLSREQKPEWMIQAMQAGVRHFLLKDNITADLLGVLQRLVPNTSTRNGMQGSIVTVLSCGGGCGATTLAVNLAAELHLAASESTLLVDMDCWYGGAAGYVGVNASYGLADALADGDRIDSHLIQTTAVACGDYFHMLVSPATVNIDNPAPMPQEHLARALQACRKTYMYTVVDAPRVSMDVAARLARASSMTYLMLELNVEDIRVARAIYSALTNRGIAPERVLPLASRFRGRREMITLAEAQRAIGSTQLGHLSNDYQSVLSSINYGKPLAANSPRSILRQDIQNLAQGVRASVSRAKRVMV
jgi:pilus assembly protein CpaE